MYSHCQLEFDQSDRQQLFTPSHSFLSDKRLRQIGALQCYLKNVKSLIMIDIEININLRLVSKLERVIIISITKNIT